jgi:HTH-type transcriptional regulator / antitoxin HigA
MAIEMIKSELDYKNALSRLEVIFDAKIGSPESDEADVLGLLIDEYEKKHFPIESTSRIKE